MTRVVVAWLVTAFLVACSSTSGADCDARKGGGDPCPCPVPPPTCGTPCNPDGLPPLCIYGFSGDLAMFCSQGVWEREGYVNCTPYDRDASTD